METSVRRHKKRKLSSMVSTTCIKAALEVLHKSVNLVDVAVIIQASLTRKLCMQGFHGTDDNFGGPPCKLLKPILWRIFQRR